MEALAPQRRRRLRCFQPTARAELRPAADEANRESEWTTPLQGPTDSRAEPLLDLASNDYLGLSREVEVLKAAAAELTRSGLGAGASRLVSGSRPVHQALEQQLAEWLGRERVLLFPSGFQANLAAVVALVDRRGLVLADRLIHHSLLVGVRSSGARLQRFAHNDVADLERRLAQAEAERPSQRRLVLVESLYSMEGTSPDLEAIAACCLRHGALLLVDEAHALGVLGAEGRGLARGCAGVGLVSGTLGKAFGSGGAFLAAEALLGDWLLQSSGGFRYTTALAPPLAAGALAALQWLRRHPEAGQELLAEALRWRQALQQAGWPRPPGQGPILSLLLGDDQRALELEMQLERHGLLGIAIRPPTVPEGRARLRLVLRRGLPDAALPRLLAALGPGPARSGSE
ncbi:MAG: aminotransferase class I/II-fold pyridoxal phosphate-dependent enzyme [Cyanobium sp.]